MGGPSMLIYCGVSQTVISGSASSLFLNNLLRAMSCLSAFL
jgi:hypothetical protein